MKVYEASVTGYEIMSLASTASVTVQMQIPGEITTFSLNNERRDHGVRSKYTFTFKPINPISNKGSLVLTWPPQVLKPATNPTVTISPV